LNNYGRMTLTGIPNRVVITPGEPLTPIPEALNTLAHSGFDVLIELRSPSTEWHVIIRSPVPPSHPDWHIYGEGDDSDFEAAVRMAVTQLEESQARFDIKDKPTENGPTLRLI
jgi:hypothetical protein